MMIIEDTKKPSSSQSLIISQTQTISTSILQTVILSNLAYDTSIHDLKKKLKQGIRDRYLHLQDVSMIKRMISMDPYLEIIQNPQIHKGKLIHKLSSGSFPIQSHHYSVIQENRFCESSNSYNILSLCTLRKTTRNPTELEKQQLISTRTSIKEASKDYIKPMDLHRIVFISRNIIRKFGDDYMNMAILAKILKKEPVYLIKSWNEARNLCIKENTALIKNIQFFDKNKCPKKVQPFRYTRLFCSICHLYICNHHYLEPNDDEDFDVDYEYSSYKTRFICSNFSKNQGDDSIWIHTYCCPKNLQSKCYRKSTAAGPECISLFKKYEREFIQNFCLKYGIKNPCFIRLLLNSDKTCAQILTYARRVSHLDSLLINQSVISSQNTGHIKRKIHKQNKNKSIFNINYDACFHENDICNDECPCVQARGACERFCGCSKQCPYRFNGCNCKPFACKTSNKCPCANGQRDCDPNICLSCCSEINVKFLIKQKMLKIPYCPNTSMLYHVRPRLLLGKSNICDGMGIFAGQALKKGEFLGEYTGELLKNEATYNREILYEMIDLSYVFQYTNFESIDSIFMGNKMRFLNHGSYGLDNALTMIRFAAGCLKIGFYAKTDIKVGEEILFDYGAQYQLPWVLEFNEKRKRDLREQRKNIKNDRRNKHADIDLFGDQFYIHDNDML